MSNDHGSGVLHFSSDMLPAEHRLEEWQDVLGSVFTGCQSSSMAPDAFTVDLSVAMGASAVVGETHCAAVRNQRTSQCLGDGGDDFFVYLVREGTGWFQQGEDRHLLRPGDAVMGTFTRPFDSGWFDANGMGIRLNRSLFGCADMQRQAGKLVEGPEARLLMSYATALFAEAGRGLTIGPMHERHLAELVSALVFGLGEDSGTGAASAARVSSMRETIIRHYADPGLSMRHVARSVGLSERAGYLAFERARLSFSEELQNVRLDRARERLRAGASRVIDIAYEVGFSDASHFHRLFKRRFGCTPGEYRALALAESVPARGSEG